MSRQRTHTSRIGSIGLLVMLTVALPTANAAAAKPDRLYPVAESYSAGETATMVGYVKQATRGESRALFIESLPIGAAGHPADATLLEVGRLDVSATAHRGRHSYRVFAEFVVPEEFEPGTYRVFYDMAAGPIGGLKASKLRVGIEPDRRIRRVWALDEPQILNLEPDALIKVPGGTTSAAEILSGSYFDQQNPSAARGLGTKDLQLAAPPVGLPIAELGLEIGEVPLSTDAVNLGASNSSAVNAGWTLAAAAAILATLLVVFGPPGASDSLQHPRRRRGAAD